MSTPPTGFWRRLRWYYDGKPDLSRPDPARYFHVVGWGPFPLPGEKAGLQRAEDEAREMYRMAEEAEKR